MSIRSSASATARSSSPASRRQLTSAGVACAAAPAASASRAERANTTSAPAQVLAVAHQLERPERRGRCELWLGRWGDRRRGIVGKVERLDGHDVALDGKRAEQ